MVSNPDIEADRGAILLVRFLSAVDTYLSSAGCRLPYLRFPRPFAKPVRFVCGEAGPQFRRAVFVDVHCDRRDFHRQERRRPARADTPVQTRQREKIARFIN